MRFTKMHGLGNDYVYIDAMTDPALEDIDWPTVAPQMSHRHTGIGADGVIVICQPASPQHHARMRTFNADGSESEACGNGTRCVARFLRDRLGLHDNLLLIESDKRVLECEPLRDGRVRVSMGAPGLHLEHCDIDADALASTDPLAIDFDGHPLRFHSISMGNPHAVVFREENPWLGSDLAAEARRLGPRIERHPAFRARVNAHLVTVHSPTHASVDTWERGAGPTQACGTGACAVLVAGALTGRLRALARLTLPGGDLAVQWTPVEIGGDGVVRQTGPATFVFEGEYTHAAEGTPA